MTDFRNRRRLADERGFTLVELLVVILIIGVLAAIAIPSFLNQKEKAVDSQAKELARTAQTTAETIASDNGGSYASITAPSVLGQTEKTIPTAESKSTAWLSAAKGTGNSFEVTAEAEPSEDTYTIKRNSEGVVTHICETPTTQPSGGCLKPGVAGGW